MKSNPLAGLVIVGLIVAAVAIALTRGNTAENNSATTTPAPTQSVATTAQPSPATSITPSVSPSGGASLTTPVGTISIDMDEQNDSGVSGTVSLEEKDGKTIVTLTTVGSVSASMPAHIHAGQCPEPGAVKYPLTAVVNGKSVTTLNTTLASLRAQGDLAINVHKSAQELNVYVACTDLSL